MVSLFGASCCREDFGTGPLRQLDSSQPHATRCGMDEHPIVGFQMSQTVQTINSREEGNWNRRRFGHRHAGGRGRDMIRTYRHVSAEAAFGDRHHFIAWFYFLGSGAYAGNDSGTLGAERTSLAWIHSKSAKHVPEVQP